MSQERFQRHFNKQHMMLSPKQEDTKSDLLEAASNFHPGDGITGGNELTVFAPNDEIIVGVIIGRDENNPILYRWKLLYKCPVDRSLDESPEPRMGIEDAFARGLSADEINPSSAHEVVGGSLFAPGNSTEENSDGVGEDVIEENTYPAVEVSSNTEVPVDGTAIVILSPVPGGDYYTFSYSRNFFWARITKVTQTTCGGGACGSGGICWTENDTFLATFTEKTGSYSDLPDEVYLPPSGSEMLWVGTSSAKCPNGMLLGLTIEAVNDNPLGQIYAMEDTNGPVLIYNTFSSSGTCNPEFELVFNITTATGNPGLDCDGSPAAAGTATVTVTKAPTTSSCCPKSGSTLTLTITNKTGDFVDYPNTVTLTEAPNPDLPSADWTDSGTISSDEWDWYFSGPNGTLFTPAPSTCTGMTNFLPISCTQTPSFQAVYHISAPAGSTCVGGCTITITETGGEGYHPICSEDSPGSGPVAGEILYEYAWEEVIRILGGNGCPRFVKNPLPSTGYRRYRSGHHKIGKNLAHEANNRLVLVPQYVLMQASYRIDPAGPDLSTVNCEYLFRVDAVPEDEEEEPDVPDENLAWRNFCIANELWEQEFKGTVEGGYHPTENIRLVGCGCDCGGDSGGSGDPGECCEGVSPEYLCVHIADIELGDLIDFLPDGDFHCTIRKVRDDEIGTLYGACFYIPNARHHGPPGTARPVIGEWVGVAFWKIKPSVNLTGPCYWFGIASTCAGRSGALESARCYSAWGVSAQSDWVNQAVCEPEFKIENAGYGPKLVTIEAASSSTECDDVYPIPCNRCKECCHDGQGNLLPLPSAFIADFSGTGVFAGLPGSLFQPSPWLWGANCVGSIYNSPGPPFCSDSTNHPVTRNLWAAMAIPFASNNGNNNSDDDVYWTVGCAPGGTIGNPIMEWFLSHTNYPGIYARTTGCPPLTFNYVCPDGTAAITLEAECSEEDCENAPCIWGCAAPSLSYDLLTNNGCEQCISPPAIFPGGADNCGSPDCCQPGQNYYANCDGTPYDCGQEGTWHCWYDPDMDEYYCSDLLETDQLVSGPYQTEAECLASCGLDCSTGSCKFQCIQLGAGYLWAPIEGEQNCPDDCFCPPADDCCSTCDANNVGAIYDAPCNPG